MVFLLAGMVLTMAAQQIFASVPFFGGWGGTDVIPLPTLGPISLADKKAVYFLGLIFLGLNLLVYKALFNKHIAEPFFARLADLNSVDESLFFNQARLIQNFPQMSACCFGHIYPLNRDLVLRAL